MKVVCWSLSQVALGIYPSFNHLDEPLDPIRFDLRGFDLGDGYCGALCESRMDLEECCNAMGFHRWSSVERPCFCCDCSQTDLYNFPANVETSHWKRRDAKAYNEDIRRALMVREVTCADTLRLLLGALVMDGRTQGFAGMCLMNDFAALNLPRGSRLLETGPVRDLHNLANLTVPLVLSFFNAAGNHGLHFIRPLYSVIGFSIDMLCLDAMHICDLGITQLLEAAVFMRLLLNNFAQSSSHFADMRLRDNLLRLRRRIRAYYNSMPRARGTMSAIGKLSLKMLGHETDHPRLAAKAAETRNLMHLLPQICLESRVYLGERGNFLEAACIELDAWYNIMKSCDRHLSRANLSDLRRHATRFLTYWKHFGGHMIPKHHFFWHLSERADMHGNPRLYWTYSDEAENRLMAIVAQSVHAGPRFYDSFLQKVLPEEAGA